MRRRTLHLCIFASLRLVQQLNNLISREFMRLKSNLITRIGTRDGSFLFKGKGWGHGVGMCQYGMKYLGELGYGYQEILGYYYPGAEVTRLKDFEEDPHF